MASRAFFSVITRSRICAHERRHARSGTEHNKITRRSAKRTAQQPKGLARSLARVRAGGSVLTYHVGIRREDSESLLLKERLLDDLSIARCAERRGVGNDRIADAHATRTTADTGTGASN